MNTKYWPRRVALLTALALIVSLWAAPAGAQDNTDFKATVVDEEVGLARGLAVGDITGDGNLDILVAQVIDGPVFYYRGNGNGSFASAEVFDPELKGAYGIALGDINKDGTTDIVVTDFRNDSLQWYSTDGQGGFSSPMIVDNALGGAARADLGDLNGDGNLDIVATAYNSGLVRWYQGNGHGNFSGAFTLERGLCGAWETRVADIDIDGDLDIVATGDDQVLAYRNNDNIFQREVVDGDDPIARGFQMIDLNGDRAPEIIVASFRNALFVYPNNGDGTFGERIVIDDDLVGAWEVAVSDFNGDGQLDLVATTRTGLVLHTGEGDLTFSPPIFLNTEIDSWRGVGAGDVDKDGFMDVVAVGSEGSATLVVYHGGPGIVSPPPPPEDEEMSPADVPSDDLWPSVVLESTLADVVELDLADMNGDGAQDVAAVGREGLVRVYPSDGEGGFTYPITLDEALTGGQTIAFGDLNGDGLMDVTAAGTEQVRQYVQSGRGRFSPPRTVSEKGAIGVGTGDIDGNGSAEIVTVDDAAILETHSAQGGDFEPVQVESDLCFAVEIEVEDVNGDQAADILLGWGAEVRIYPNNGNGTIQAFDRQPISAKTFLGGSIGLETGHLNQDNRLDLMSVDYFSSQAVTLLNIGNPRSVPAFAFSNQTLATGPEGLLAGALGDMTGDGLDDIITTGSPASAIFLHVNQGARGFSQPVMIGFSELGAFRVAIGDVTGDEKNDLVAILGDTIQIFSGNGTGGSLLPPSVAFNDVSPSSVHAPFIDQLRYLEVAESDEAGRFLPNELADRAQTATWLAGLWDAADNRCPVVRAPFQDYDRSAPFASAVNCLYGLRVVLGITDQEFGPNQPVTRAQAASLLTRLWERDGNQCVGEDTYFDDISGNIHASSINCLASLGVIAGISEDTFAPDQTITRAQLATLTARIWEHIKPSE